MTRAKHGTPTTLLSGGNPQIAKADGDAPVQAYIGAMPGWKRDLGERLDALIARSAPNVREAAKWNSLFYGINGQGWFLSFHVFKAYVKVTFFKGASLRPRIRYLDPSLVGLGLGRVVVVPVPPLVGRGLRIAFGESSQTSWRPSGVMSR